MSIDHRIARFRVKMQRWVPGLYAAGAVCFLFSFIFLAVIDFVFEAQPTSSILIPFGVAAGLVASIASAAILYAVTVVLHYYMNSRFMLVRRKGADQDGWLVELSGQNIIRTSRIRSSRWAFWQEGQNRKIQEMNLPTVVSVDSSIELPLEDSGQESWLTTMISLRFKFKEDYQLWLACIEQSGNQHYTSVTSEQIKQILQHELEKVVQVSFEQECVNHGEEFRLKNFSTKRLMDYIVQGLINHSLLRGYGPVMKPEFHVK